MSEQSSSVLIIAGPTASGKTAAALATAQKTPSVILNADALQLYADLPILTARPTLREQGDVPHMLFGVLAADVRRSVAWWCEEAAAAIQWAAKDGRQAILVGGTGLYLQTLTVGLAPVPEIPEDILEEAAERVKEDPQVVWQMLRDADAAEGERLWPLNPARLVRAWSVWRATGKMLGWWHQQPHRQFLRVPPQWQFCEVDRATLRRRIEKRFDAMLAAGAVEEVESLLARGVTTEAPVFRALGAIQIAAYLQGDLTWAEMRREALHKSFQYAKRQETWFRHQLSRRL